MTEIKICGITRLEDALAAAAAGADALGFIFAPESPRRVTPERVRRITAELPGGIVTVGVFANQDAAFVEDVAASCGLGLIQLHGDESPEYCLRFPRERLIKAVWPSVKDDIGSLADYPVKAFLSDGRDGRRRGGTGRTADWTLAAEVGRAYPLVLAGGLGEDNVREALALVRPRAVDVNSGVELAPGIKDPGRMRRLIAAVREFTGGRDGNEGRAILRRTPVPGETGSAKSDRTERDSP